MAWLGSSWREVVRTGPRERGDLWPALSVTLAVCCPLALLAALDRPGWIGYAVFGSLSVVFGRGMPRRARITTRLEAMAAMTGSVVLGAAVGVLSPGGLLAVLAGAVASVAGALLVRTRGWVPGPSLFMVFATGTLASFAQEPADLLVAGLCALATGTFGTVLGFVGRAGPVVVGTLSRRDVVVHGIGPLVAGGVATLAGIGHPYWAAVAATVPLVGPSASARWGRAGQRVLGTFVGVLVAAGVLLLNPPVWVLVSVVALAQTGTELWVRRNYGVAVACITPVALILSHLAAPSSVSSLVVDRVLETVLGVSVTVALLLVLPGRPADPP